MEDAILENDTEKATSIEATETADLHEDVDCTPQEDTEDAESTPDYAAMAAEDLMALKAQFPALEAISSLSELPDPARYGELRELGLSAREAYLATGGAVRKKSDNRAHLLSAVPRTSASVGEIMTGEQMAEARRLFSDLNDAQIHRLYKKVTN